MKPGWSICVEYRQSAIVYHIGGICVIGQNLNNFPDNEKGNTKDKKKEASCVRPSAKQALTYGVILRSIYNLQNDSQPYKWFLYILYRWGEGPAFAAERTCGLSQQ